MHVTEIVRVAAEAWHKVKPAEDPEFNNCALSHREKLVAQTQRVVETGGVSDDFETAVKEIVDSMLKVPEPEMAKIAESKPKNGAAKKKSAKK